MESNELNNFATEEVSENTVPEDVMQNNDESSVLDTVEDSTDESTEPVEAVAADNQFSPVESTAKKPPVKAIIIAVVALLILIAGFFAVTKFIIPLTDYNEAVSLRENNKFDEAVEIFESLKNFKDSKKQIEITLEEKEKYEVNQIIAEAKKLYDDGCFVEAYKLVKTIENKELVGDVDDKLKAAMLDSVKNDYTEKESGSFVKYFPSDSNASDIRISFDKAFVVFYCTETPGSPYSFTVVMDIDFAAGFVSPIKPQTVTFSNSKSSVELRIGYGEASSTYQHQLRMYFEEADTSLSLEDFNKIVEIIQDEEEPTVTISGNGVQKDFILSEENQNFIVNSKDYINALYLSHYDGSLPSEKITKETSYEEAVRIMIDIIDMIGPDGLTQSLVDDLTVTYNKISAIETDNNELSTQVNTVYNLYNSFYIYCLDPYIHKGESGYPMVDSVYIATYKTTTLTLAEPKLQALKNML